MTIGVDLMGGDRPPEELYQAVEELKDSYKLKVFADPSVIDELVGSTVPSVVCSQIITMDDHPLQAVRQKQDASLVQGIKALQAGDIAAFVSAGNTGAMIVAAALFMQRLPGVDRPALLASLPSARGPVTVLDVGGNVSAKARHIVQFAHVGAAYHSCIHGQARPTVGLLNIGVEAQKGGQEQRKIYQALASERSSDFEFLGNVEGRDVFQGAVDVLVTDGFSGNVFLKAAEGVSNFILNSLQDIPQAKEIAKLVDYAEHPGALVTGVEGVLVKCHGSACKRALANGISGAARLLKYDLLNTIRQQILNMP